MLAREHALYDLSNVDQKVETISHLQCVRCPFTRALSVAATPVTADDLYARMRAEPDGEAASSAIWKKIDRPMFVQIHQHGAVALPFASRPVVDAKNLWGLHRGKRRCVHQA